MIVVESLVAVPDASLGEALRRDPRAVVDAVLDSPDAVDIDAAE
jgi:hypothetical protein